MDYRTQAPPILRNFLAYHETIQGHSRKTADEYFLDLRTFFRYVKIEKGKVSRTTPLDEISIDDVVEQNLQVVDMTASILARDNRMPMWVFGLNEENSIVNTLKGKFNGTKVTV